MTENVTNSQKDWDDFWYNSKDITPVKSINKTGNVQCFVDNEEVDCTTWKPIQPWRTLRNY